MPTSLALQPSRASTQGHLCTPFSQDTVLAQKGGAQGPGHISSGLLPPNRLGCCLWEADGNTGPLSQASQGACKFSQGNASP